jgi:hypothetical protein
MITPLYLASIWGGILTLAALPLLCLMDIRTRKVPDAFLWLYAALTVPAMLMLYATGLPWTYAAISLLCCGIWLLARQFNAWGGADTKFLMLFSLAVPLNPLNLYQQQFQLFFTVILALAICGTIITTRNKPGAPMMVPIAVAIVAAMIGGMFV